jgi:hypothetical protein
MSPILFPGKKLRLYFLLLRTYTGDGQFNVFGSWIDLCWRHRRKDSLARNLCGSKVVKHIVYLYRFDATVSGYQRTNLLFHTGDHL